MNRLYDEIERARRYSSLLSLLMIDLNDFKHFNDTYGHLRGDTLLREVARLLKNSVRSPDFVARYGGDEFVIVMPESGKEEAVKLAKRLRGEVHSYPFEKLIIGNGENVSVSIGLSTFPSEAEDVNRLIHIADTRLYEGKKSLGD